MGRTTQVLGIGHERIAIQILGKQFLTKLNRRLLRHVLKTSCFPNRLGRLHNEGGGVPIVLIGVRLKPAMLGFLDGKRKSVKQFARA